ncbi:MAG: QueT transporter family protein [Ruminococcus sp.]|nr:QueT transporter family protein [Ruminococcus sp.]
MTKTTKRSTMFIVQGAAIAALYAVLTIAQNLLLPGSASWAVQFRVSEAMTVLAFFMPAAIPGLTVGCVLANISSVTAGLGLYDMVFGSIATLLAALCMYALRNVKLKDVPFVGLLMPAVFNGLIIGFEIDFFFIGSMSFNFADFLVQGGFVALGELVVLFVLGLPLTLIIKKQHIDKDLVK